jgi:hypothetical protein
MKTTTTLVILVCFNVLFAFGQEKLEGDKKPIKISRESDDWPSDTRTQEEIATFEAQLRKRALKYKKQRTQSMRSAATPSPVGTCNIITCGSFHADDVTFNNSWGGEKIAVDGSAYGANVSYSCWKDNGTVDYSEGQYISYSNSDANDDTPAIISPSPDGGGFAIFSYQNESIFQDMAVTPNTNYTACFEIAVIPRYSNRDGDFQEFEPELKFGIGSGGIQISDPLHYTHNDINIHPASDFPTTLSTATSGPFQNPGGWTEIDPFWETVCITFQSDNSGTVNVFYQTGNPGRSVVLIDGLRLSLQGYAEPPTFSTSAGTAQHKSIMFCDAQKIDLNSLVIDDAPTGSVLTWSTNVDPLVTSDHLTDTEVTPPGTYYAFYYNSTDNCSSPAVQLDLLVSDFDAKILSKTDTDCDDTKNGSIIANGIAGTEPYMYSIDGGNNYQSSGEFTDLGVGNYTITVKDANDCIKEVSTAIASIDKEDPIITAPGDYSFEGCDENDISDLPYSDVEVVITLAQLQAALDGGGDASDDIEIDSITYIDVATGDICSTVVTRTFTVTDGCGNTASDTQTITINDTTAPTFNETLPLDITVECDEIPNAEVLTADDSCSNVAVSFDETRTDGSCANEYTLTRQWFAIDECGNEASHKQTITVQDTTAPTFTVPADIEIFTDADCNYDASVAVTGDVTDEADNCSTGLDATFSDAVADGACEGTYVITRTWTLTDECGNETSHDQTITVSDNIKPTFTAPADIEIFADADCNYDASVAVTGDVTDEADNCSTGLDATFSDSVADGPCEGTHIITRTWSLVDNCGNAADDQIQTITVSDNIAPEFVEALPADATVECDQVPDAATLTATDNCSDATVTFNEVRTDGDCPSNYTLARTWTATDECGNETAHTQTLTVQDTTSPSFVEALPADATVECDEVPDAATLTATDH